MGGRELVAAHFDNTLSEADSERLAVWIAQSPENARFFAEWSVLEDHIGERYGVAEFDATGNPPDPERAHGLPLDGSDSDGLP